jgi:hypothetical protein
MKKILLTMMIGFAGLVEAETVTNNLDVQDGFVYNHGVINPDDYGLTFTNAGIRDVTVSVGQLCGVNPENGEIITNTANLLPLQVQSLESAADIYAVSDITTGGRFVGDGSGLTGLPTGELDSRYLQQSGGVITGSLQVTGPVIASEQGYYIGENQVLSSSTDNEIDTTFVGIGAGQFSTNTDAIFVGVNAGQYNDGESAVFMGEDAGQHNAGEFSIGIGEDAGRYNTGDYTLMVVRDAGWANSGDYGVLIGRGAGRNNTGYNANLVGRNAGYDNTGDDVLLIGQSAGYNNTGDRVIGLGRWAGYSNAVNDRLFIDFNNKGTNTLIYGEFNNRLIRINGDLGVTGALRIAPQGGLSMGSYTNGTLQ